jgi:hypothetical protein
VTALDLVRIMRANLKLLALAALIVVRPHLESGPATVQVDETQVVSHVHRMTEGRALLEPR